MLMLLGACVDISGGAVEFSWAIRNPDGEGSDCVAAQMDAVRLRARPLAGGPDLVAEFLCNDFHGTTTFRIPEGEYALCIEPVCSSAAATRVIATVPSPIVRTITLGDVVQLNALLIETDEAGTGTVCREPLPAEGTERGNCLDGFK
jgi:hypothetical protein